MVTCLSILAAEEYKRLHVKFSKLCTSISIRYNRIINSIYSIIYNISYMIRLTSRLSKKPIIVIIKLLYRYLIRSEFVICFRLARKYPISFYYFIRYNQSIPFIIIYIIRVYNFITLNHVFIQEVLYEFGILEDLLDNFVYILGDDPMRNLRKGPINNPQMPKVPKPDDYIVVSSDSDNSEDENVIKESTDITSYNKVSVADLLNKSTETVQKGVINSDNVEPAAIDKGKKRMPTREYALRQSVRKMFSSQSSMPSTSTDGLNMVADKTTIPAITLTEPDKGEKLISNRAEVKDRNLLAPPRKNRFARAIFPDKPVDSLSTNSSASLNSIINEIKGRDYKFITTGPADYENLYTTSTSSTSNNHKYLKTLTNEELLLFYVEADSSSDEETLHIGSLPSLSGNSPKDVTPFIHTTFSDYRVIYRESIREYNYKRMYPTNDFKADYTNLEFVNTLVGKDFVPGPLDVDMLEFTKNLEPKHIYSIPEVKAKGKTNLSKIRKYLEQFEEGYHDTDYDSEVDADPIPVTRGEKRAHSEDEYNFDEMYSRKRFRFDLEHFRKAILSKLEPKKEELEVISLRAPASSPIDLTDNSVVKPKVKFVALPASSDEESHDSLYSVSSDDDSGDEKTSSSKAVSDTSKNTFKVPWKDVNPQREEVKDNPHIYKWVKNTTDRWTNIYNFAFTKHPKLDFCTFTGDYLGGNNDLLNLELLDEPVGHPLMSYGYNKFLDIFYEYNDVISGVLPNNKYYDYMYGARSNYRPSKDLKLISISPAFGQLEMEFPVCYSSYIRTVDGISTDGLDLYNMRNKHHIRDINKVFNNYYSPGYIPKDVFPHLWLEDAYKFLLKSKFDVNRLPDGTYEYIVHDLGFTPEEEETIKEESILLNMNGSGEDEFYEREAIQDQTFKISAYADYIKRNIAEKAEWLFDLEYIDDPEGEKILNSSSVIFKQWIPYNISEALKDTICVLNKHYIANNPVWPYGMQDRRWFGIAHDKYNEHYNKTGENDLLKVDDKKYRDFYNLPSPSQNSTDNLEYKYVVDTDGLYNTMAYLDLKDSDLDDNKRKFIDKRAWGEKTSGDVAFESNPLYTENFKGENPRFIPYTHDLLHKIDFHYPNMPIVDIEDTLRNLSLDYTAKKSYISKLSNDSSLIERGIDGLDIRKDRALSKSFWHSSFSVKKTVPKLGATPWTFKIPSSADQFTNDYYLWENKHCRGLVPKEFTYAYDLPDKDLFRFIKVNVETSDPVYPSGSYIYSKHNLKKIFTEYELSMKWTKETCKLIDRNNILLYFNLFHNNSRHLCLPCADKVVNYNQYLKSELSKHADTYFHDNVFSHMKKTMESHFLLYTRRADSLEASYDKLMSRLSTNIEPQKVWTKVELKKEELKNITYEERKFFRYLVLRDFEYAMKYDEKFDIRGTLLTEEKARKWDKGHTIEKLVKEKWDIMQRVENMVGKPNAQASSSRINK